MSHKRLKEPTHDEILAEAKACVHHAVKVSMNAFNSMRRSVELGEMTWIEAKNIFHTEGWVLDDVEIGILKAAQFVFDKAKVSYGQS